MDAGRYGQQQGWDNNSAFEGYSNAHGNHYRGDDDRRYAEERYQRAESYSRNNLNREFNDRESYPSDGFGSWNQNRRKPYEEENSVERVSKRHEKSYNEATTYIDHDKPQDGYRNSEYYQDRGYDRNAKSDDYGYDGYEYRSRNNRESSRDRDHDYERHNYDSDYEKSGKRGNKVKYDIYDQDRVKKRSRERESPRKRHQHFRSRSRSRSRGRDRSLSRSPQSRSQREESYERTDKKEDRDDKRQRKTFVAPSATVVLKGLLATTTEEDLYHILAEWGPLRHVRVIKERSSGLSRGFAFVDFPSTDAASAMMEKVVHSGLLIDGKRIFLEYSKPTGSGSFGFENSGKSGFPGHRGSIVSSDWLCSICDCINFARRTSCFQCNEPRTEDALPADATTNMYFGKRGYETGPTHVLVVRGFDENADEEMLRYEFSKHAVVKDLRLVRDKFTHVSRGFAFVHFYSVEDATKALDATNGTTLEKNGQILRVQYAKSIFGIGSSSSGYLQSSSLAAAAIEAAAFAQQYDATGWTPTEYNPDEKTNSVAQDQGAVALETTQEHQPPISGFVWDESSGYYYDAASGFYYDANTGLYYDGNNGIWYSYDNQTQQYVPCTEHTDNTPTVQPQQTPDDPTNQKIVISAPPTVASADQTPSLSDAVQAAASAALAAEKKEKEKAKEIKFASKSSILASKKKMNNVLTMWKQRSHEGSAPEEKPTKTKPKPAAPSESSAVKSDGPSKEDATSSKNEAPSTGKRRFTETPSSSQTVYRDRAAERRSLYGSSPILDDDDMERYRMSGAEATPYQGEEVVGGERAIDESNVGNRMLRNMGWQEGSGLGKDGSGMREPVRAQAVDSRAGLGSHKRVDPDLEVHAGDSYKTLIHKKALARFREMS